MQLQCWPTVYFLITRLGVCSSWNYDDIAFETDRTFLNEEDFRLARILQPGDLYAEKEAVLPQPNKYRGDIVGKAALIMKRLRTRRKNLRRNGVRMLFDKWPGSQIPYIISQRYNQKDRAILARAFQTYHEKTCVRFIPHTTERDYLYIGKIDGCFSDVGRAGGRQEVSLDDGCIQYDTAIHELMHAVGFWHEHERSDRDEFITIVWQNIAKDAFDQFGKVNLFESDYYGESYDYFSIMHYDSRSFSKNGRSTIEAKQPGMTYVIGKVKDFSATDIRKINKMYNCAVFPTGKEWVAMSNGAGNSVHYSPPRQPPPLLYEQAPSPLLPEVSLSSSQTCHDKGTMCNLWRTRCWHPNSEWFLKYYCPLACGVCNETFFDPVAVPVYRSPFIW